jgi:hypothetical protein
MASKACNRPHPLSFDACSPSETVYHFPISPGEPGKFDFYRVYLANHAHYSDSTCSDDSDAPTVSKPTTSLITKKRWTPFADVTFTDESKSSTSMSSLVPPSNSLVKSQTMSSLDSNALSNTNGTQNGSAQSVHSFSSLTDAVKSVMNKGHLGSKLNQTRRPLTGTTLSTKDLNHLSPQSM